MNRSDKILILGSSGMVGSALTRLFQADNYERVFHPLRKELDLFRQADVESYFHDIQPDYVFMAAARVGGIIANDKFRGDFIFENLQIQQNVFNAAFKMKTKNLLFLGSSCIYPKHAPQPMKEEYLLTSPLEYTNEAYAVAKIAGLKSVENFRKQYGYNWLSVMPTNLYGVNDNFDPETSHVIPGLISRMHEAITKNESTFKVWGTGKARREFLYVDDLALACRHFMAYPGQKPDWVNIGSGEDIEIAELAKLIAKKMGFKGELVFDTSKPDGTPRKWLDVSKITAIGWKPTVSLDDGLDRTIHYFHQRGRR